MAWFGSLSTHGEAAIAYAQMGNRQTDTHLRVGAIVWFVLSLGGWIFAEILLPEDVNVPLWTTATIVLGAGIVSVLVANSLNRRTLQKLEYKAAEIRALDAAEKARKMAAFEKSKSE